MEERFGRVRDRIRDVPDFPKPGIVFKDITPLLGDPEAFREACDGLAAAFRGRDIGAVFGIESRGFIFGTPVAERLGVPFVPIRKPGKLPSATIRESYALEYGEDAVEVHEDAIAAGTRVLLVDDLLATGGTAAAACRLIERLGGEVAGCGFVIELGFLRGRERLGERVVEVLVRYE